MENTMPVGQVTAKIHEDKPDSNGAGKKSKGLKILSVVRTVFIYLLAAGIIIAA